MIPYNKINEGQKCKIVSRYKELGYGSQKIIQQEMNISDRAVSRILKEAEVNTKRKNDYTLNESFFSDVNNEKKAYMLGFMYADGFNGGINHISVSLKSEEHLKKIIDLLEFTGKIKDRISGFDKPQKLLSFSSKQMSEDLTRYGVVVGKAEYIKTLPPISEELMRHFIRGYFDGDGSIYSTKSSTKSNGKTYTYTVYEVEIIGNRNFLDAIGIEFSKVGITYNFKKSKTSYMQYLRVKGGRNLRILYDYFYKNATIYLTYKHEKQPTLNPVKR